MRHLITGGSGFLGNLIANELIKKGEEVSILDVWEDVSRNPKINFFKVDILDRQNVLKAMKNIDVVHHNVALVPLTKAGKKFWQVNVVGSKIAAECANESGIKTFIHMSSSAIFGVPKDAPITSNSATYPVEIYGRAKLEGEKAVIDTFSNSQTNLIVIRPRTILGEGRLGIFQILFDWISNNKNIYTIGNGNNKFQFIHASDLLSAYMLIMEKGLSGTYNVGTDRFSTMKEALNSLIEFAHSSSEVKALPEKPAINLLKFLDKVKLSPLAPYHYLTYSKNFYFDVDPLIELGWRAKYSNDDMLRESYDWYLNNKKNLLQDNVKSAHRRRVSGRVLNIVKKFS